MREIQYKDFSLMTHQKNWQTGNVNLCQFELTFKCNFHCKYCYSDCYNQSEFIKKELTTQQIKFVLDKLYSRGVIWLVFTGGDPLTRSDFFDIYDYAKQLGFIISIFTTAYCIDDKIAAYLKRKPPFIVEVTFNSIKKETFERICGLENSFVRSMQGLKLLIKNKIPLKIKTVLINDNIEEIWLIKRFIENLNLRFFPAFYIKARLDKNRFPCSLRLNPKQALSVNKELNPELRFFRECARPDKKAKQEDSPFYCPVGFGDSLTITPYGEILFCSHLRNGCLNILTNSIEEARLAFIKAIREKKYLTDSKCSFCRLKRYCFSCPGEAYLETGDLEAPIKWWCEMADLVAKEQNQTVALLNC